MFARKSLRVEYQVVEQSTIIDPATAEHIELMSSLGQSKSKLSLFGVLNHCSTQGGVRLLRSNLFQPPIDKKVITDRLEVVEELIDNMSLHHNLKSLISRFPDLDPVLTLCSNISSAQIDAKIDRMVALKQVLELLPPLHQLLQGSTSHLCKVASTMLSKQVNTSTLLLEMMHLVLIENAAITKGSGAIKFSRALAVKPDVNGLLDIARTTFCEYVEFLEVYVAELGEEHQLPLRASLPRLPVMVKNLLVTSNLSLPPPPQPSKALLPSYSSSAGLSRSFSSESSPTIFGVGTPAEPVVFLLHLILSALLLFFLHPQSLHHCSSPTLAPWRADSTRGELFRFRRHSTLPTPHHLLHTHSSLHKTCMEKEHAWDSSSPPYPDFMYVEQQQKCLLLLA